MDQTTPTPPAPARTAEPLARRRDDTVVLGVCAGIARTFGIPPLWLRLGAVALGVVVPVVALLAYALLGVVVRRDDGRLALGGEPDDDRETLVAWTLTLLAAFIALRADGLLLAASPSRVMVLAVLVAAAVVAWAARSAPPAGAPAGRAAEAEPVAGLTTPIVADGDTTLVPPARTDASGDDDTVRMPPAPATPGRPGPSLFFIGLGVLAVLAIGTVIVNPVEWLALGPTHAVASGAGGLGFVALAGIVTAIVFSGRRHATGLLALSILVGLMAVGLASVAEEAGAAGSEPLVRYVLDRGADLLRLR